MDLINGNPFQYSCLENPRDGGAWWAAVYGVAQSQTWLKRLSSSSSSSSHPYKLFCRLGFGSDLVFPGTLKGNSSECLKCLTNKFGLATGSALNCSKKSGLVDVWPLQFHLKLRDKTSTHQLLKITFRIRLLLLLLSRFSRVQLCANHRWQPTRQCHPWDSPGKNTGVGCHFLLQCMKVKSESVAQSCPTLLDPMDCSPPDSSVHGIFQARVLEWVAIAFSAESGRECQMKFWVFHSWSTEKWHCYIKHLAANHALLLQSCSEEFSEIS